MALRERAADSRRAPRSVLGAYCVAAWRRARSTISSFA